MKNPVILMNPINFKNFKKELESKMQNFKVGNNPTYEGVPIKTRKYIKQGTVIVYDDIPNNKRYQVTNLQLADWDTVVIGDTKKIILILFKTFNYFYNIIEKEKK
jgi:hypothetical protein